MIEEHADPTAEAHAHISNLLRTVVTAAAGAAERRAQRQAEQAREAQRAAAAERRDTEVRIAAERQTAELVYRRAYRDTWWERAKPAEIAEVVMAAGTWAAADPRADDALAQVSERLAERHGLDLDLRSACRSQAGPAGAATTVGDQVAAAMAAKPSQPGFDAGAVVMDAAGPTLGAALVASEGWPRLQHRLETMAAGGADVTGRLRTVIAARELDTAADKALALSWRLKDPATRTSGTRGATRAARQTAHGPAQRGKSSDPGKASSSGAARLARQQATDRARQAGFGRDADPDAGR